MTVEQVINKLNEMVKANKALKKATFQIEYKGDGGCDTCGYGSEVTTDVEKERFVDLETRLVLSIA